MRMQHGNIAKPYQPFGLLEFFKIDLIDNSANSVTAPAAQYGIYSIIIHHLL